MWTLASFQPTSFFSLRPANATTSGGKTLLTPTPFSLKMALLDVAIRLYGKEQGLAWFPALRDLAVAVRLPQHLSVVNTFVKIMRPHKNGPKDVYGTGLLAPLGNTIAYKEYVHYPTPIDFAFASPPNSSADDPKPMPLAKLLTQIHYLGKRGGFMQFLRLETVANLPESFTPLNGVASDSFPLRGTLQLLDDCGSALKAADADVFNGKNSALKLNHAKGRQLNPVVLPYQAIQFSRSYTLYEHI